MTSSRRPKIKRGYVKITTPNRDYGRIYTRLYALLRFKSFGPLIMILIGCSESDLISADYIRVKEHDLLAKVKGVTSTICTKVNSSLILPDVGLPF